MISLRFPSHFRLFRQPRAPRGYYMFAVCPLCIIWRNTTRRYVCVTGDEGRDDIPWLDSTSEAFFVVIPGFRD